MKKLKSIFSEWLYEVIQVETLKRGSKTTRGEG